MPGFNTLPAVGGGGGQANMTFVASVHMETYNRSWAQGGTPGYYAMYSTNQENGYVYFVGATTTGGALNRLIYVSHPFTSINIIAPTNDMVSLYKAKVKSTTLFNDPFAAFTSFPSVITSSGNFVLPNNALPLVNVLITGPGGGGGHGEHNGGGGGGGGGGVVKLTAFQAVGTTSVTIGGGHGGHNGGNGSNRTYFGNVYAIGGGGGGHSRGHSGGQGANGGGGGGTGSAGAGWTVAQGGAGLGNSGSPVYHGGFSGGHGNGNDHHHRSGGGGGAGGTGGNGNDQGNGHGGNGHVSDIEGSNHSYGAGGPGSQYNSHGSYGYNHQGVGSARGHGERGGRQNEGGTTGASGAVIVRYYIP